MEKGYYAGQTVFVVIPGSSYLKPDVIREGTVLKVGRIYITLNNGSKFKKNNIQYGGIPGELSNLKRNYLFQDRKSAEKYVEMKKASQYIIDHYSRFAFEAEQDKIMEVYEIMKSHFDNK